MDTKQKYLKRKNPTIQYMCFSWFIHPIPFAFTPTYAPQSMCLMNNRKDSISITPMKKIPFIVGACRALTWKPLKISHTGDGKRPSRTEPGLYGIHPFQKTKEIGTNNGQGRAAMVVTTLFLFIILLFIFLIYPSVKPKTGKWKPTREPWNERKL